MSAMIDDMEARRLLEIWTRDTYRVMPTNQQAKDLACTVLALHAELAQARADAAAAQARGMERAAEQADPWDGPVTKNKIVDAQAIAAQQIKARIRAEAAAIRRAADAPAQETTKPDPAEYEWNARYDAAWPPREKT